MKKKTITPQSALQEALAENARDIALIEPEPERWGMVDILSAGAVGGGSGEEGEDHRI